MFSTMNIKDNKVVIYECVSGIVERMKQEVNTGRRVNVVSSKLVKVGHKKELQASLVLVRNKFALGSLVSTKLRFMVIEKIMDHLLLSAAVNDIDVFLNKDSCSIASLCVGSSTCPCSFPPPCNVINDSYQTVLISGL
jgi:hypothetical protein